jgi:hypothetical protein
MKFSNELPRQYQTPLRSSVRNSKPKNLQSFIGLFTLGLVGWFIFVDGRYSMWKVAKVTPKQREFSWKDVSRHDLEIFHERVMIPITAQTIYIFGIC